MNIRAILLDMDGTLLGRSQVAVSVRNMEALARAMEKSVAVIPCTGRVFDMMPPQLLTMEGLRYYITSHGAAAYDRLEKKNIYEDTIPADEAAQLMEMLEGRGLYNEIAARNTIWLEKAIADTLEAQPVPAMTGLRPAAAFTAVSISFTRSSKVSRLASPVVPVTMRESHRSFWIRYSMSSAYLP